MQYLESISISLGLFAATVILVVVILNFILKMRLINSGQNNPESLKILSSTFNYKESALKWGIILLFGGIGLVVIYFIPEAALLESPLPYGIEMIFLAIGFLVYYLLVRNEREK